MKRLIVNADDLGYTQGVNRTVARCAAEGVVRSTTLMANGAAFQDAVAMVRGSRSLGVGIHLVLTELEPVSRPEEIPGLVDEDGLLPPTPAALMLSVLLGKIRRETIYKELDRQVSKVLDHGLTPTHLDSHKHVHLFPQILEAVIDVARKHSIRWIRNPFDVSFDWRLFAAVDRGDKTVFLKQQLDASLAWAFRRAFFRAVRRSGLRTPDHFFGVSITGIWNEALVSRVLQGMPDGVNEWMAHPGECDRELLRYKTRLREQREKERDLLLSPLFKELLNRYGIVLTRYGEEIG